MCQVPLGEEGCICGKEINGRYTTNLKAHLKHAHPIVHAEIQRKNERKRKRTLGKSLAKELLRS